MTPVQAILEDLIASSFFTAENAPLAATLHRGDPASNVIIVGGTNASGKSLIIRILASWLHGDGIEPIQVSMRYRAGTEVSGMQRLMMFGSEDDESTGVLSTGAVKKAMTTAHDREKPHWVMFDEPDIGLSTEYAIPMGRMLGLFATAPAPQTQGIVIVSHSKPLIEGLLREAGSRPHFLHMDGTDTLDAWLKGSQERSIEELTALQEKGRERWGVIEAFLKERRKKQSS